MEQTAAEKQENFFYENFRQKPPFLRRPVLWLLGIFAGVSFGVFTLFALSSRPPADFPLGSSILIPKGTGFSQTAALLEEQGVIRSGMWFKVLGIFLGGAGSVKAGEYFLTERLSLPRVVWSVTRGDFNADPLRLTIPEGTNNEQMAQLFEKRLTHFDREVFLSLAKAHEGYLFPDTYHFPPDTDAEAVIRIMRENFSTRIASVSDALEQFGKPLSEVVIMASLIEEEARTDDTRRQVSGILWKRLEVGMPLQVDAVFPFIFNGQPFDLTNGDLAMDSPYNTYRYAGLPPGPITNPGLDAIRAAITPVETPYWFYLSDGEGTMHYAVTHDEHMVNRTRYLGM